MTNMVPIHAFPQHNRVPGNVVIIQPGDPDSVAEEVQKAPVDKTRFILISPTKALTEEIARKTLEATP